MNYSKIMSLPSPFASKSGGGVMTPQLLWERRPWTWLFDTWRSVTFVKVSLPSLELRRLDTDLFDSVFFG